MIILIGGSSHTGKTYWAQQLVKRYHYSCLSLDHLKMGLIRSGYTQLTSEDDSQLTDLLWPIVREMIKTAIENRQNMIIEGCYIPFDWKADFDKSYEREIRAIWLVMTEQYIRNQFNRIREHANVIERRLDDSGCCMEDLIRDNRQCLEGCRQQREAVVLIDDRYPGECEIVTHIESQEERL